MKKPTPPFRHRLVGGVVMALSLTSAFAAPDLWIRDDANDVGDEPNNLSPVFYLSDDIWVRRLADPNYDPRPFPLNNPAWVPLPHQGPCYRDPKTSSPNYLYVRVRNRGNSASSGNETLHVYWAKASTGLSWPTDWKDHLDNPCGGDPRLYGYEVTKPRKNGATASNAEQMDYVAAIQAIDTAAFQFPDGITYFDKLNVQHTYVFQGINNVHYTLGFFPWHREFMNRYEALLREESPALTLLYWDWTTDPSPTILGGGGFMGAASGVVGAPFAGFGLTRSKPGLNPGAYAAGLAPAYQTGTILPSGNFATVWNNVEGPSHDNAHCYLGGTVCSFNAARDPMFFMIHANADRIWSLWQRQNVNRWTPAIAYDASQGSAAISANLKPWDGSGAISPWLNQIPGDPEGYIIHKSPLHHSIIYPPIYDDALLTIPVLQPGECSIIEIPFYPPPATECNGFQDPQHLCLLARIEPVSVAEGVSVWNNVKNNNNIAWRNVTLSDCNVGPFFLAAPGRIGAAGEIIRNLRTQPADVTLRFDAVRTGFRTLFNFGRVRLRLEDNLMRAWQGGGQQGTGIEPAGNNEILVFNTGATLAGLQLAGRELGRMDVALELDRGYQHPFGDVFHLDLLQFDDQGEQEPVGGVRFTLDFNQLPIVTKESDWRFLDGGGVPGRDWTLPTYDDTTWKTGTAPFGYGRADVATGLRGSNGEPSTVYFRQTFLVPDPAFYRNLALNYVLDDGLAVYLNGEEIARLNLPTGPLTPETPASTPLTGAAARACRSLDLTHALQLLVPGQNLLAAEVHPARPAAGDLGADLTFDLELAGNVPDAPYQPPTVVIVAPPGGAHFVEGADVPILAEVFDPDNDLTEVRIYTDGRLLARLTNQPPFTALFNDPGLGSHRVSVEAEDRFAHVTRMDSVFSVRANLLPVVNLLSPDPDVIVEEGKTVTFAAEAMDPDGQVRQVAFYVKGHNRFDHPRTLVGVSSNAPYAVEVKGLAPNRYLALAEATDDAGARGYSLSSHFLVASPKIRLQRDRSLLWIEWDHHEAVLESSFSLPDNWEPVADATSPHIITPEGRTQFFRVRLPRSPAQQ